MTGEYNGWLVFFSVFISVVASYAALEFALRITTGRKTQKAGWLWVGSLIMGAGIWAMHYIGMAAFVLPFPVLYDWPTVLLSLLASIIASATALYIVSGPTMSSYRTISGSIAMGFAISAMHYIGMEAMRMPAFVVYSIPLVSLSLLAAILISFGALKITFKSREQQTPVTGRKVASAIVMGLAIPVMHYVGMASATFRPLPYVPGGLSHARSVSDLGLVTIIVTVLSILIVTVIYSSLDRLVKQQAQDLIRGQLQLQAIFDNMADGVVVLDEKLNIIQANAAAMNLLGLQDRFVSADRTYETLELLFPDGTPVPVEQLPSVRAIKGEFLNYVDYIIRRKDTGAMVFADINTTPIRDRHGKITQIIVGFRDVASRLENSTARARLAAIVDSSEDAIIGKDGNGIVQSWNTAAEKIFGYKAEEMIGQSILRLVPADLEEEELSFLSRIRQGEIIAHVETIRKRKDGKQIHVSLTISPIRDAKKRVIGASKIARDITERRLLERQLQQSQKMEAIGQLTGGIAHDFNNLLGVIIGNLSLLERSVGEQPKAVQQIHTAQKASWRGADLIRRLLTFSSDEQLSPASVSLDQSINNLIELATRALGSDIVIAKRLELYVPPIFVDASGLESAMLNLAVNARDAMPKGGTLTIATQLKTVDQSYPPVKTSEIEPGLYATVSLTDTGYGMSQETLARVFEPFFTTKPRGKGTGLGLAMVYGFAKQSGGTVRIYSEIGYGTTVTLYLPLAKNIAIAQPKVAAKSIAAKPGTTVLIVDDEADLVNIARAYLLDLGFQCLQAGDGASALEVLAQNPNVELIITDIVMPGGINGVELVQQIRLVRPEIKVIYSSGFSADALAERNGTKVDGLLLHKPYQQREFNSIVTRAMESPA